MKSRLTERGKSRAMLLALCALWSLVSLRSALLPGFAAEMDYLPPLERQALQFAVLASALIAIAVARGVEPLSLRGAKIGAFIGAGLFAAPALLTIAASYAVPELTRVALFSLAPAFAAVLEPHLGRDDFALPRSALPAALAVVAGSLLLYPISMPHTVALGVRILFVALAAFVSAATNCWAVRHSQSDTSVLPMAAIATATATLIFASCSAVTERQAWTLSGFGAIVAWTLVVDLPATVLLFKLLQIMPATQMSLRFVLAPWLASVVSLALFASRPSAAQVAGLVVIAVGAAVILFARASAHQEGESPLHLH